MTIDYIGLAFMITFQNVILCPTYQKHLFKINQISWIINANSFGTTDEEFS